MRLYLLNRWATRPHPSSPPLAPTSSPSRAGNPPHPLPPPPLSSQLKYSGVFEAVAIRKSGYPFRLSHKQFAHRYSCILPQAAAARLKLDASSIRPTVEAMTSTYLPTAAELITAASKLAEASGTPPPTTVPLTDLRVGKTKVF